MLVEITFLVEHRIGTVTPTPVSTILQVGRSESLRENVHDLFRWIPYSDDVSRNIDTHLQWFHGWTGTASATSVQTNIEWRWDLACQRECPRDFCVEFRFILRRALSISPDDSSSTFSDGFRRIACSFLARCKNNIADQRYKSKYFHESFMELISCKHSPSSSSFNSLSLLSLQCDYFSCVWREKQKRTRWSPAVEWQNVETGTLGYFLSMGHLFCREQNMTIIDTVDLPLLSIWIHQEKTAKWLLKGSRAMVDMCAEGENLLQNPQIDRDVVQFDASSPQSPERAVLNRWRPLLSIENPPSINSLIWDRFDLIRWNKTQKFHLFGVNLWKSSVIDLLIWIPRDSSMREIVGWCGRVSFSH